MGPLPSMQTTANSNYHGLQVQGTKRFSQTFFASGSLHVFEGHRPDLLPTRMKEWVRPIHSTCGRARSDQFQGGAYRFAVVDRGPAQLQAKPRTLRLMA